MKQCPNCYMEACYKEEHFSEYTDETDGYFWHCRWCDWRSELILVLHSADDAQQPAPSTSFVALTYTQK